MPEISFEFAQLLPEPILLIGRTGKIYKANPPAQKALQAAEGMHLQELDWKNPEKLMNFVRLCAGTRQWLPGSFLFKSGFYSVDYRAEGCFIPTMAAEENGAILLRFHLREEANQTFLELNKRIAGLSAEMRKRLRAEEELRRSQQALQEANQQLQLYSLKLETLVAERTGKLQESLRSMELFCYSMAHDLRAPLRAISGFTQALLEDYNQFLDQPGRDFARRIMGATERMDRLIFDLLSYAKLSQGELPLEELSLQTFAEKALANLAVETRDAEIRVASPLGTVRANDLALEKIFHNLLSNALKFVSLDKNPRIEVSATQRGEWVRCCIRDNGIGIAEKHQAKIFGLFERLHGPDHYPGTGIGLALVAKCVERLDGKFGLDSAPGQGSCFWFELKGCSPAVSLNSKSQIRTSIQ